MDLAFWPVARLIYQLSGSQDQATLDRVLLYLAESDGLAAAQAIRRPGRAFLIIGIGDPT